MPDYTCLVSMAVDLSRLSKDPYAEIQLRRLLTIGREVDLLEALRRSEEKASLTTEMVIIHATSLGIDAALVESFILQAFQNHKMIDIDDLRITLKYTETQQVYEYGKARFEEKATDKESALAELICKGNRGPIPIEELDDVLTLFPIDFRSGLKRFLTENNVLTVFTYKEELYVISPRIYKNEKKFNEAVEILTDNKFGNIIDFVEKNPGNPSSVVEDHLKTDKGILDALSQLGIVDPIRLDVKGDARDYVFGADVLNQRQYKDHFDLARKTLANFRFGEYYSKKTRLYNLDRFLEYMLEHGYAGRAEAIGTDYENLEMAGVFRIEKLPGTEDYRFWMLKKDVVEDARSILRGYIPLQSSEKVGGITKIEGIVQARQKLGVQLDSDSLKAATKALRQIQEALTSS